LLLTLVVYTKTTIVTGLLANL